MFAIGHVEGGTNAGRRIVKPTPKPWVCVPCELATKTIGQTLPAYLVQCPRCKKARPGGG